MLKDFVKAEKPQDEELKQRIREAGEKLAAQQNQIKEHKIPVLVLMEGWGTAGKGSLIGEVIKYLDPRFFKVAAMNVPTEEEKRKPFLYRYFQKIPEAGKFMFLDTGWMDEITRQRLNGEMDDKVYEQRLESVRNFERQLTDNGYVVLKFFCHISEKEQKKRIHELEGSIDTKWRIGAYDEWQNKHYEKCLKVYDRYMEETNQSSAPWYVVDSKSRKGAELQILETLTQAIDVALQNRGQAVPILQNRFILKKMPLLKEISLDKTMTDEEYKKDLKKLQHQLRDLHNRLYRKKVPLILAYEGWDAAGKGGNIKRVAQALDARAYTIFPSPAPTKPELAHPFLWRYWTRLPKAGHVGMYDRSWYGRVLVERVEGFATPAEWSRAYDEINEFEHDLVDWGAILLKFWVDVSPEEQLRRFQDREDDPAKQWKITEDDWRNREKYPQYKAAIDDMFRLTSTTFAPWIVLESDDKRYARIKALRIIVEALEKRLGECPAS